MKAKKLLMLAIFSGFITTIFFYIFINQAASTPAETSPVTEVVTASEDIARNQQITEENTVIVEMQEDQAHPQAVTDQEMILNRFASAEIKEGEVILNHRVEQGEEADFISKKIEEGNRAVSISVDYVKSVSNLVEPEDFVDVVLSEEEDSQHAAVHTELVLDKVRVLAVGERMVDPDVEEGGTEEYHAVTLELSPEQSIEVINASERGTLQLALHSKRHTTSEAKLVQQTAGTALGAGDYVIPMPDSSMIRSEPHINASINTVVAAGTELQFLDEQQADNDNRVWYLVETPGGKQGWISSRIVNEKEE
ncbi:Flp pilus assembly protein CpaB [Thalassorhabdus alkalitolerans]|uniref:Flp pilus assembly protein CpaB n=1 Tax=Thalassorhabdus alkalitolerans TaxID=2282697 RepID=A0ABW0YJQ7_9BACI